LVAFAASAACFAQTSVPATPSLSVGAEIKGLRFDWEPVTDASWYELEYQAHKGAPFVQHLDDHPASVTTARHRFPLHLFDWTGARYRLAACNSAGCARSTEISVSSLRRFAVGYFKPAETQIGLRFGADTDIAANGLNFVSAAPGELIASSSGPRAGGAIYVFRRSAGVWIQRARLVPTIPPFIEASNVMKVAMSADGNTVALGMPNYFHEEFDERSGEVFVFRFNGSSWVRTRLPAIARGAFGRWVALNDAGDTLAIARGEALDPPVPRRVDIYKLANGAWTPVRSIGDMPGHTEFCDQGVLSGDGSTVAESCREGAVGSTLARVYVRLHSGTNWTTRVDLPLEMSVSSEFGYGQGGIAVDGTGNRVAAQIFVANGPNPQDGPSEVQVFERTDGVWWKAATLTPGAWRAHAQRNFYGQSIAFSGDGEDLVVGDTWDNGLGLGPRAEPLNPGQARTGAVYVYRFRQNWWYLYNMVKPNYHPETAPYLTFGSDVELSGSGMALIVGESGESSDAEGISGSFSNIRAPGSGAVWLY
ncbi:MAG TPA: hypothetical protein VFO82_09985, partial [Steroidobacteraceae bacterium]|nr:hypothetical protein [Steroidobacteraceae bacterium]